MERFLFNGHVEKVRQILIKVLAVGLLVISFGFLYDFLDGVLDNYWIIIQLSAKIIHCLLWTVLCFGIFLKRRELMLPWLWIWVPTFMVSFYLNSICQLLIFTKRHIWSIRWINWNQKLKLKTKNQNIFCWCKWKFDNFFIHFE